MSSGATRRNPRRLIAGVVAATAALFTVGIVTASGASAAVSLVTPTARYQPTGTSATFTVTPTAGDTLIAAITGHTNAAGDTVSCAASGSSYTCTVDNTAGAGVDTVTFTAQKRTCVLLFCQTNDDGTATATANFVDPATIRLSASPSGQQVPVGGVATFNILATDASVHFVDGASVYEVITAGPDAAPTHYALCGTTSGGIVQCNVQRTTSGLDTLTFFVPLSAGAGPAGLPQTTAGLDAEPAYDSITVSCPTPGATGAAQSSCLIPAGQGHVTFTATATRGGVAVAGAQVSFTTGGTATGTTPGSAVVNTDATGKASYTVTVPAGSAGKTVTTQATIGAANGTGGSCTGSTAACTALGLAQVQSPVAQPLTLTPATQTVHAGSPISVVASVLDQFGAPVVGDKIAFTVSAGPDSAVPAAQVTTDATGRATFTYTSSAATANTFDTVQAADASTGTTLTATVQYTAATGAADRIVVSLPTSGQTCGATPPATPRTTASSAVATDASHNSLVCAWVTDSSGSPLPGRSLSFTVSKGVVGAAATVTAATGSSGYTVAAGTGGQAQAFVGSRTSGGQTITVSDGTGAGTATITYAPGATAAVSITPSSANLAGGTTRAFTATTRDSLGNAVPGAIVVFSRTGPGTFGGSASTTATTASNGTASATLRVASGAAVGASGTVTAASNGKSSSAHYTVTGRTEKPTLALSATTGRLTATVRTNPAIAGATVHLYTVNANGSIKAYVGHAKANHAGVARRVFTAVRPGGRYTMIAKVVGSSGFRQQYSAPASATLPAPQVSSLGLSVGSASAHHVHAVMTVHPSLSGVTVRLYTVSLAGVLKQVAAARTNSHGVARVTMSSARSGKTYYFVAGVLTSTGAVQAASKVESITAK